MTYLIVIILVLLSGLFSGLTLGLLSLNTTELKRKMDLGDKDAEQVYPVRKRGNLLLCTLLLGNVAVNSALAIFLGNIASGLLAGVISTALIVVFGEIIPQASISRYALQVGAKTAWLVRIFMIVFFPICAPIAWILDKVLGEEMPTVYSKKELMKIVAEHEDLDASDVDADEERIIIGALSFSEKQARDIMTPRDDVFALSEDILLTYDILKKIQEEGFTRIPVYYGQFDNLVGILNVKDLITMEPDSKVADLCEHQKLLIVKKRKRLDSLLNLLLAEKTHMAIVKDQDQPVAGVVTLEDIIEEILDQEIVDETDEDED